MYTMIENYEYEKNQELLEKANQDITKKETARKMLSFLFAPFKGIKNLLSWIKDEIAIRTIPKEERAALIKEAIIEAKAEQIKEKNNASVYVNSKKMEIVQNSKLSIDKKLMNLSNLCHEKKMDFEMVTNKGAFRFECYGDDVIIKHAFPEQKTKNANISYNYKTVGGVAYEENSTKVAYLDLYNVVTMFDRGEEFDLTERELGNGILKEESENIAEPEQGEMVKQFTPEEEKNLNEAIEKGDLQQVEELVNMKTMEEAVKNPDIEGADLPEVGEDISDEEYESFLQECAEDRIPMQPINVLDKLNEFSQESGHAEFSTSHEDSEYDL